MAFPMGFPKAWECPPKASTGIRNGPVYYRLIAGWEYPKSRSPTVVYRVFPLELVSPRVSAGLRVAAHCRFLGAVTPQLERFLVDRSCWLYLLPQGRPCSFYPGFERGPFLPTESFWRYSIGTNLA